MQFRVSYPWSILVATLLFMSLPCSISSEPVQYCHHASVGNEMDFCMSVLPCTNVSSNFQDLHLTLNITRSGKEFLGWSALGLGRMMDGGLMFVVYGHPDYAGQPVTSVRTSTGHSPPKLAALEDKNGVDVRVIGAQWVKSYAFARPTVAMISLICYSCTLSQGSGAAVASNPQSWMWAFNYEQEMSTSELDASLNMYGEGGWGQFLVNMPPSFGGPDNTMATSMMSGEPDLGHNNNDRPSAGNAAMSIGQNYQVPYLHGILMAAAFLLLSPTGALAIGSGFPLAFKYRSLIQVVACGFTGVGFMLGLLRRHQVNSMHQLIGCSLVACLGIQGLLGWRHHVIFLRVHRRTWLSHCHIWMGRLLMTGGWGNLITGIVLSGHSRLAVTAAAMLVGGEALGFLAVWWRRRRGRVQGDLAMKWNSAEYETNDVDYFALGEDDKEEETEI